jgi:hypothetical protein
VLAFLGGITPAMVDFLKQGVDKLETIKKVDPKIFK